MNPLQQLYAGDFNEMFQEWQPDGSVIITLHRRNESAAHRIHVKDLYGKHEEVLKDEIIEDKVPEHIKDRMKEAKEK